MTVSSIILEGFLACLCLQKKSYNHLVTFVLSLTLVAGIYILVNELLFLALICLLSYYGQECKGKRALVFLGGFFYFLTALVLDYRPQIFY